MESQAQNLSPVEKGWKESPGTGTAGPAEQGAPRGVLEGGVLLLRTRSSGANGAPPG